MQATAKDLRFHASRLLESVKRGEEIVITYRGKPCAKLVPFDHENDAQDSASNPLFGIWRDRDDIDKVDEYVRTLRKGRFDAD